VIIRVYSIAYFAKFPLFALTDTCVLPENQGRQRVTSSKKIFQTAAHMAKDKSSKRKLPYAAADITAIEDRLDILKGQLGEIRRGLKPDRGFATVELKLGTLVHYIALMEEIMPRLMGDFASQSRKAESRHIDAAVATTRRKVDARRKAIDAK
jgi:hypothetical protein